MVKIPKRKTIKEWQKLQSDTVPQSLNLLDTDEENSHRFNKTIPFVQYINVTTKYFTKLSITKTFNCIEWNTFTV